MASRIQYRRDTASNWTSENPVLAQGEPGYETDTGKEKLGDGSTAWTSLAYGGVSTLLGLTDVGPDGSNGQVLTTDGAGAFTFTTASGGSTTLLGLTDVGSDGSNGQMLTTDGAGSFTFTTTNIGNDLTDINSIASQSGTNMVLQGGGGSADLTITPGTSTQIHQILKTTYLNNSVTTLTSQSGNQSIDGNNGALQVFELGGDLNLYQITNVSNGDSGTVIVKQPATSDIGFKLNQISTGAGGSGVVGTLQTVNGGNTQYGTGSHSEIRYFKFNWHVVDSLAICSDVEGPLYGGS